ncbi:hypothetical protein llap_9693 [Limosa lapponica baueri]|uniref:DUF4503 domain-containing protein n=1 Tax=Limosa lapponica baueri TaxID=1758121 RepID=A0A2I0U1T7_LIMLA|nr:hypothetical protein llap_9693 [Limosa lapponica baueri]
MFCRLCLLVQDAYGMFSEVQLQSLSSADDIEQYCRRWEGKFCCLAGMKILQRTTRGRCDGNHSKAIAEMNIREYLFTQSIIRLQNSLPLDKWISRASGISEHMMGYASEEGYAYWIKYTHCSSQIEVGFECCLANKENEFYSFCEMTTNLPPPSFCYILTVQSGEIHVEVDEEEQISNLYQPPAVHSVKEILQIDGCNERCSFWARVLYLRLQTKRSDPLNQREICLFVTDSTLQNVVHITPKVVAVSVAASCHLSTEVTEALSVASQLVFFKDALWGNGRIICVERTVLLLQKPLLCSAAGADLSELTGPVRLDELDSTTQANSVCAVRGLYGLF